MTLTSLQKILWGLVGVAAATVMALQIWGTDSTEVAATHDTAFKAVFELTDHTGMIRTQDDFAGKWMLVFFGFTNCPDVCPTTLAEVAAVMDGLASDASFVQPLFISIDPARDGPQALAEFVPQFDAGIVGLTGTPEQIERTVEGFYIFYEKVAEAAAPGGYTMGHSSQLFLFGPEGDFLKTYAYGTPAEDILADLTGRLRE